MLFYLSLLETEEQKKNFVEIYEKNRDRMYHTAYGILKQKEEAENAVHDAFLKLADKFGRYERLSEREMGGLCITIARNTAINMLQKQERSILLEEGALEALYQQNGEEKMGLPEEEAIGKEEAELVRRLLRELPAAHHDILVLRYYYRLSVKEAAGILGISGNAAQVRLHRAKEKLREIWSKEGM